MDWCPQLDETFPYMLLGWSANKVGMNSGRKTATDPGRGVCAQADTHGRGGSYEEHVCFPHSTGTC